MAAPVPLPGVYTIIMDQHTTAEPDQKWRNTYDFKWDVAPDPSNALVLSMIQFQKALLDPDVTLDEARVYNWMKGTPIYPAGLPLFVIPINASGNSTSDWGVAVRGAPLGGEVCLRFDRTHFGQGKPGRLFARGLVRSNDVASTTGGKWFLTNTAEFNQTTLEGIITNTGVRPFLDSGPTSTHRLVIVQYSPKNHVVSGSHDQHDFVLQNVTTNKQTRKNKK